MFIGADFGNERSETNHDSTSLIKLVLSDAVRQLPERQRIIIELIEAGFKQRDIAIILGLSRTSIYTERRRAAATILNLLSGLLTYA